MNASYSGPPHQVYAAPPPQPAPRKFHALAWSSLICGIVGTVGSPIIFLNNLTAVIAAVGIVLGIIALFGTSRTIAGIGIAVGVAAIALTVVVQGNAVEELDREFGELTDETPGAPPATEDVALAGCEIVDDGYGFTSAQADLTITNSTDAPRSYLVTISLNNASGARLGELNTSSSSLAAGQSVRLSGLDASGLAPEGVRAGPIACAVADVDRF